MLSAKNSRIILIV